MEENILIVWRGRETMYDRQLSSLLLLREDIGKRWPSMNQEVGLHQTTNLLAPWSWTFQPPEPRKINVLFVNHQSMLSLLEQSEQTKTWIYLNLGKLGILCLARKKAEMISADLSSWENTLHFLFQTVTLLPLFHDLNVAFIDNN